MAVRRVEGRLQDVDECAEDNGGCDEGCENRPGGHLCSCPAGWELGQDGNTATPVCHTPHLSLVSPAGHRCVDTNECQGNNGHGPCQDGCSNTAGGYQCDCRDLPGTSLASDGESERSSETVWQCGVCRTLLPGGGHVQAGQRRLQPHLPQQPGPGAPLSPAICCTQLYRCTAHAPPGCSWPRIGTPA